MSPSRRRIVGAARDDGDDVVLGGGGRLVARLGGHERLLGFGRMEDLDVIKIGLGVFFRLDTDECHRFFLSCLRRN